MALSPVAVSPPSSPLNDEVSSDLQHGSVASSAILNSPPYNLITVIGPLKTWKDGELFIDSFCRKIIFQTLDGLYVASYNPETGESGSDQIFCRYQSSTLAKSIYLSHDSSFVGALHVEGSSASLRIFHILHPEPGFRIEVPIPMLSNGSVSDASKTAKECRSGSPEFFWLNDRGIVVISPTAIEVLRLNTAYMNVTSLFKFNITSFCCWWEAKTGYVVVATEPNTLVPFRIGFETPAQLPKLEIHLMHWQTIRKCDVAIVELYGEAYCIYADVLSGRVSIRSLPSPNVSADTVLDAGGPGEFQLMKVDNLLIIHRPDANAFYAFDILSRGVNSVTGARVIRPLGDDCFRIFPGHYPVRLPTASHSEIGRISIGAEDSHQEYVEHPCEQKINVHSPQGSPVALCDGFVVFKSSSREDSERCLYNLSLEAAVLCQLLKDTFRKEDVVRVSLRRSNFRDPLICLLREFIDERTPLEEMSFVFGALNSAYLRTLKLKEGPVDEEQKHVQSEPAVLNQKDMASKVFIPSLSRPLEGPASPPEPEATESSTKDSSLIQSDEKVKNNDNYILSLVLEYNHSLASLMIAPTETILFDICIYMNNSLLLHQLFQYHLIPDLSVLPSKLLELAKHRDKDFPWATQACLDSALRLGDWNVLAEVLLQRKAYLEFIPIFRQRNIPNAPVKRLLKALCDDVQSQHRDPDLLSNILTSLRLWIEESESMKELQKGRELNMKSMVSPDLEGCETWFLPDRPNAISKAP